MTENWDDPLILTLRIKRHQLVYRDNGTLYALHDNIGSQIHIGDGETTEVVSIESDEREDSQPSQDHSGVYECRDDLGCTCAVQQEDQNEHDEEQHGQNHAGKWCTHGSDATPGWTENG